MMYVNYTSIKTEPFLIFFENLQKEGKLVLRTTQNTCPLETNTYLFKILK